MPTAPLIPDGVPFSALANVIYNLPAYPVLVAYQSVAGATLQTSVDGTNFSNTDTSAANEARSIQLAQVFVRFTTNTTVVVKKAFMAVYNQQSGGGGVGTFSRILNGDGTAALPSYSFQSDQNTGFYSALGDIAGYSAGGVLSMLFQGGGILNLRGNAAQIAMGTADDLILVREAAQTLAQRNGTNGQTQLVYGTYTNASNYERLKIAMGAGCTISTEMAGTGVAQSLFLGTGNSNRWLISGTTGHFLSNSDNNYDIGALGANRPRTLYLGGGAVLGNVTSNAGGQWMVGLSGGEMYLGDASVTTRVRASLATPGSLTNGDWWVECVGTSPSRVCAIKVRDGGATRTIASITY